MTKTPFHDDFYIFRADKGKIFTDENNTRYGTMIVAERIGKIIEIDDDRGLKHGTDNKEL